MTPRRSDGPPHPAETAERTLPHNLEAERAILGAVLLHNEALDAAADVVDSSHFFRDAHRRIFDKMIALSARGIAIDLVTLREELDRHGDLDECGGPAYLAALIDGVPRGSNVAHYAKVVREKHVLRSVIFASNKATAQAYAGEAPPGEIATDAAEALHEIGGDTLGGEALLLADLIGAGMSAIEKAYETKSGAVTGLATGFTKLDDLTAGLQPSDLIIVAARPSQGKTALALNIARAVDAVVLVFSLEMSKEQLFLRMLSSESEVDSHRLRSGWLNDADWGPISAALSVLQGLRILIDDRAGAGVREVRARARQVKAKHGLGLIVIDQVSHMRGRGKFDNRREEIGGISRGVKGVAKELNVPIILLSQLSRDVEGGRGKKARRPQLSDLAESSSLEADADVVIFPFRPEQKDDEAPPDGREAAELIVAKQRNGPVGVVKVFWNKELVRFENVAV
ncbi:MAG: replicative DNA helicase [Pseudomonadota bacterium]